MDHENDSGSQACPCLYIFHQKDGDADSMEHGFPQCEVLRKVSFCLFAVLGHAFSTYFYFLRYVCHCKSCNEYMLETCVRCDAPQYHGMVREFPNGFGNDDPSVWAMSVTRRCGEMTEWGSSWAKLHGISEEDYRNRKILFKE